MYEAHFGLNFRPFRDTGDASDYVPTPSRETARLRLRYGLEHCEAPCLILGPPGSGKTLMSRVIAADLGGPTAHVTFPAMSPEQLVHFLADEFLHGGANTSLLAPGRENLSASLRRFRGWLANEASRETKPLLVVDDAHLIRDDRVFETLKLLLDLSTTRGPSDLRLLLVGEPELLDRLPESLHERIAGRCELQAWLSDETFTYLDDRIRRAGGSPGLFAPEVARAIHRVSFGLPRRINRLADLALVVACAEGLQRPDLASVEAAAREMPFRPIAA